MSDFTTQLRFICESYAGVDQSHPQTIDDIIENSRESIFDFSYPIFDEAYKPELETKIINHFYTQEIGQETVGLFKQRLKTKMREIMPYYNQLYMSERIKFDPLKNADYVDLHNMQSEGTRDTTSDNTSTFNNSTVNDVDNRHTDNTDSTSTNTGATTENGQSKDLKNAIGSETAAGTSVNETKYGKTTDDSGTNTANNATSGQSKLTKEGSEMVSDTPINYTNVITTEADTPLGKTPANHVVSSGGQGNNGNTINIGGAVHEGYNSKVTQVETVQGSEGGKFNHAWKNTRYGKFYDTDAAIKPVTSDERKDITISSGSSSNVDTTESRQVLGGKDTVSGNTTDNKTHTNQESGDNSYSKDGTSTDVGTSATQQTGTYHTDNDTVATGVSTANDVGNENTKNKQDYFGKVFGKVGSETYSEMLNKFRSTFLNIDMDVIHELEPLFMLLW